MRICVYGASSTRLDPAYLAAGTELGLEIGRRGHELIFGGGENGLMGAVARGVHEAGGRIVGVTPSFFRVDGELYQLCDEMIYTNGMRDRKERMELLADAFIMTPGGVGTLDEFMEILTLRQLGRHQKPIAVLNTKGFFDPFQAMMRHAEQEHFLKSACLELYQLFKEPGPLLDALEHPCADYSDFGNFKPMKGVQP